MKLPPRRFPPPYMIEEHAESFIVRDATGQAVGYFYFDDEPQRRSAATVLSARCSILSFLVHDFHQNNHLF